MRLGKLPKVRLLLFAFIHKQEHLFFSELKNIIKIKLRGEKYD